MFVRPSIPCLNYSVSSDVQCGHLVASILTSDLQNGQTFVVGAAGASSGFFTSFSFKLFINFTKQKITNYIISKLMTAVIKFP